MDQRLCGKFVTLTYDQENLPVEDWVDTETGEIFEQLPTLERKDAQRFIKSLKRSHNRFLEKKFGRSKEKPFKSIRYYLCGEYGSETNRPHYHVLLFNVHQEYVNKGKLHDVWNRGHVHIGTLNAKTIAYTTKYVMKKASNQSLSNTVVPEFSLMSRNPGIGAGFEKSALWLKLSKKDTVRGPFGSQTLPRYYRDKIYSIKDKEELAQKKLDWADQKDQQTMERLERLGYPPGKYDVDQMRTLLSKLNKRENDKGKI